MLRRGHPLRHGRGGVEPPRRPEQVLADRPGAIAGGAVVFADAAGESKPVRGVVREKAVRDHLAAVAARSGRERRVEPQRHQAVRSPDRVQIGQDTRLERREDDRRAGPGGRGVRRPRQRDERHECRRARDRGRPEDHGQPSQTARGGGKSRGRARRSEVRRSRPDSPTRQQPRAPRRGIALDLRPGRQDHRPGTGPRKGRLPGRPFRTAGRSGLVSVVALAVVLALIVVVAVVPVPVVVELRHVDDPGRMGRSDVVAGAAEGHRRVGAAAGPDRG